MTRRLSVPQATELAKQACGAAGAGEEAAAALARATVSAEAYGRPSVGFAHLLDISRRCGRGALTARRRA